MTKKEILEFEINKGIEIIESLSTNEISTVHKIYSDIYKIYLELTKDDFIHDIYYSDFLKRNNTIKSFIETELDEMLSVKSDIYTSDNYIQIRLSLHKMLPLHILK